jgi:hypothetical protein
MGQRMDDLVRRYLGKYGYSSDIDNDSFRALRQFQLRWGLEPTGALTNETAALIATPRCGVSDIDRYVVDGRRWARWQLSLTAENGIASINVGTVRQILDAASLEWARVSALRFQMGDANSDIRLRFASGAHGDTQPFDGPGNVLAHAFFPPPNDFAGQIHMDADEHWSSASPNPNGAIDLMSVVLHELGHALGLAHSNVREAVMYPYYSGIRRTLHQDDIQGISALYPASLGTIWRSIPGAALDISIGGDAVWHLGVNRKMYRWNNNGWAPIDGDALAIAVQSDGTLWHIGLNRSIYRRDGNHWSEIPAIAYNVAAGQDGSVWHIGKGGQLYQWNGGLGWDHIDGVGAVDVAGKVNDLWHISNSGGGIYRRHGGAWIRMPGEALDLSVGADGSVWHVGQNSTSTFGNGIYRWNGSSWDQVEGAAVAIAVASNGLPWHINRRGQIFQRTS